MKKFIIEYWPIIAGCLTGILTVYFYQYNKLKKQGYKKGMEIIQIIVYKPFIGKIKAYATLKGYKNENEYINHLIDEELKNNSNKLTEGK